MALASTFILMELSTKASGRKTSNMVMAKKLGLMGRCIREITRKAGNTEMEHLFGQMDPHIQVNL
jgi:hypothetical protein